MDVEERTSGTSADVGLEDESKDYICQKISRVGKKNIDRKKIRH